MALVNQKDEAVEETQLFRPWSDTATDAERDEVIGLLLEHFRLEAWRTNATKHGNVEIELRVNKS